VELLVAVAEQAPVAGRLAIPMILVEQLFERVGLSASGHCGFSVLIEGQDRILPCDSLKGFKDRLRRSPETIVPKPLDVS
jgi:hypothetical protein